MQNATGRTSKSRQRKQLVFDCRYGWVYDEWRDPAEVAHLGGRGMFSIVPLTGAAFSRTLNMANIAADVVVENLQNPPSLQSLQITLKKVQAKTEEDIRSWFSKVKLYTSTESFPFVPNFPWLPVNLSGVGRHPLVRQPITKPTVQLEYEFVEKDAGNARPLL